MLAASFALSTYEDENQSNVQLEEASPIYEDGMGIERFQALMQAYAIHSNVQGHSTVLDSRSKVYTYVGSC